MGINIEEARAILALKCAGLVQDEILCLGRPEMFGSPAALGTLARDAGLDWPKETIRACAESRYAEPFLKQAGFSNIRALDASGYEGADIIHDLNEPIPDSLKGTASFVYDGGTCEHVFDAARALRNVIDLLAVGGVALVSSPANGQCGHGFYQFSPELFYRLFEANGFDEVAVYLVALRSPARWYRAVDPRRHGRRVQFESGESLQMFLVARKTREMPAFVPPQQSDYADAQWGQTLAGETTPRAEWSGARTALRDFVRDRLAFPAAVVARRMLGYGAPGLWRRECFPLINPNREALL